MPPSDAMRPGYHNLRRREIIELVPTSAKRILDLGCGTGELGKALKDRQRCHVTGIELNKEAFKIAEKNLDLAFCDNVNRYDPAITNQKYDCIVFGDILEHLISPWVVLIKFRKVLTDGGVVVASIPNVGHPSVVAQLERGLFRYELAGILDITHLRFFTKTTTFQLFYKAGLKVVECAAFPSTDNPQQYLITAVKPQLKFEKPLCTVVILAFNGWRFTKKCIDSLKERTFAPYKVLVVDNGSTDMTVKALRQDHSIFHVESDCNQGFSRGFNLGLELIDTPYFVICNSDTVVTPGWLTTMLKHINIEKDLVVLGPRSNYVSGPQQVEGVTYNNDKTMCEYAASRSVDELNPISYFFRIVFFFVLFKSRVLSEVGYLDDNFTKSNFEDDDYCIRVSRKRLKAAYDNTVFIHHWGRATFKENKVNWESEMKTNKALFMSKWGLTEYGPGKALHITNV